MAELLQSWVVSQAERRPEAAALILGQERMTYGQLEALSNRLARALREVGCRRGDRVCLLMPKSPLAVASVIAALKADCIYVPLDLSSPPARLAKILESCESRCLLAAGPVTGLLDQLMRQERFRKSISLGWMDSAMFEGETVQTEFSLSDLQAYSSEPLDPRNTERDPAYLLFTSGSTGVPKGVLITHSNVVHFVKWAMDYFGLESSDRISGHPPLHFDLSAFDIFGAFAAGAQLHLVPQELNILPHKLADFIRASQLSQWFSVPSILSYMAKFDVVGSDDFPALKRLLWCGEVFPTPNLIYWMKRLPHVSFTNLYGPTETTIASSFHTLSKCPEDTRDEIPIGTGCQGEELLVLDEELKPVPEGEIGYLYIRGVGLSPGYWRDPEKTRAVFLPNPSGSHATSRIYKTGDLAKISQDGLAYFCGRADSQIKSRGYRIELGEIESALNAIDLLQECAVVAIEANGFHSTAICCAYVPRPCSAVTAIALRKELGTLLPNYMLPSHWMPLTALPKNSSGKIDRRKLREEFVASCS